MEVKDSHIQNGRVVYAGEENQDRIAKIRINYQGIWYAWITFFWHAKEWTPRNDASVGRMLNTVVSSRVMKSWNLKDLVKMNGSSYSRHKWSDPEEESLRKEQWQLEEWQSTRYWIIRWSENLKKTVRINPSDRLLWLEAAYIRQCWRKMDK